MKISLTRLLILAWILSAALAFADIRQAPTMADALSDVDGDSLVVFDLDNTVMMPPQTLGGEEWYDYFVDKRTKEFETTGLSPAQAREKAIDRGLKEWTQFHLVAKVIPVELDTPKLIEGIQSKGAKTMALTARPIELADSTVAQLRSIGIDFSKSTVVKTIIRIPGKYASQFKNGALLVGPKNNKGEILVKFLKILRLKPGKIIFVDNKMHHVENVGKALEPTGIPYFGRRHGAADRKISSMDKEVVEIQHRYFFGDVLSDAQALKLK